MLRSDIVESLSKFISNENILILILNMTSDKNYIVRCDVYEALGETKSVVVFDNLIRRIKKERSSTARMYLLSAICQLIQEIGCSQEIANYLKSTFEDEKSKRVIISYLCIFYILEKHQKYVTDILEYLNEPNYHIRCVVINAIYDILDDLIISIIKVNFEKRLLIEDTIALKSSLVKFLDNY